MKRFVLAVSMIFFFAAMADDGFSRATFRNPPPEFAPSFFWLWFGKISSESKIAEYDNLAAHGAGTACIHPYPKRFRPPQIDDPMEPDFLSDGYFRIYGNVLDRIEQAGGVAWLYDEGGWPSGGACGRVMASDPERFQHRYLAAGGRIETWRGDPAVEAPYPSLIEPGTTERFLELAYEPYRRRFARHFGKTIPFVFTDEPAVPSRRHGRRLSWCSDFAKVFRERKGYDILPFCDDLIAPTNRSEAVAWARIDYHDVLADIYRERYLVPVRNWCRANGLKFGGHFGGGNHFIELQKTTSLDGAGEPDGGAKVWLMIHSGSRNLGKRIEEHYHRIANRLCTRFRVPLADPDLAFLPIEEADGHYYYTDMLFALRYAKENRRRMMEAMKETVAEFVPEVNFVRTIDIHHNYATCEEHFGKKVFVHRKGATSAKLNEIGVIPGSMGTASYIVRGLGNPDSFMSCSHGAGRRMSRIAASTTLTVEECDKAMDGIVCERWHKYRGFGKAKNRLDLSEAPQAYKDIEDVIASERDLVEPLVRLVPLASLKG